MLSVNHRFRVSATKQQEIIETSLAVDQELLDHLKGCSVCSDDAGLCSTGQPIWDRRTSASRELKLIGVGDE